MESVIYAYMETEEVNEEEVERCYERMDSEVHAYLQHLRSTVPISMIYDCHFVEVGIGLSK